MKSSAAKLIFDSEHRLRWGWTIIFYLIIVAASAALVILPLKYIFSLFDLQLGPGEPITGWVSIIGSIFTLLVMYSVFLAGTHFAQRWLRKSSLTGLGLKVDKPGARDLIIGIGLGTGIVAFATIAAWLMGWYRFLGFAWEFRPLDVLLPAFVLAIIANLQSPILEEVVFRGFIFGTLRDKWGVRAAVLISSGLFGLAHLANVDINFAWSAALISTFLAGLMFSQAYLVNNSLWLPMGIHFGWIFAGRLLNDVGGPAGKTLLLVSGVDGPSLLVSPAGGGAGLLELLGVGMAALILWRIAGGNK